MNYCMLEVAFGDRDEAIEAINKLLDNKLVASCQMIESNSYWNWENNRESSIEYLLFMKTKKEHLDNIYSIIKAIHSYECFEFAVFDLNSVSRDYLNWIDDETKKTELL